LRLCKKASSAFGFAAQQILAQSLYKNTATKPIFAQGRKGKVAEKVSLVLSPFRLFVFQIWHSNLLRLLRWD